MFSLAIIRSAIFLNIFICPVNARNIVTPRLYISLAALNFLYKAFSGGTYGCVVPNVVTFYYISASYNSFAKEKSDNFQVDPYLSILVKLISLWVKFFSWMYFRASVI